MGGGAGVGVGGVGVGVGAGVGVGVGVGVGAGVTGAFDCVTATRVDAIVSVALRCAPVFGAAVACTDAFPDPDAGLTVIHAESDAAVQLHPLLVCTEIVRFPPVAAMDAGPPETVY